MKSIALVVLTTLLAGGCSGGSARQVPDDADPLPPLTRQADGTELMTLQPSAVPGMTLTVVKEVELPKVLETTGLVSFDDRHVATVISRVAGRIEDVRVSLWDTVARGEPVVALYSPDYMTAEAEYLQAQVTATLASQRTMANDDGLVTAMVAAAKRKLELLGLDEADIAAIKAPSATWLMRAPIGGTIVERKVVRGSQVNPGDVLFTLGTLGDVWITADIFESDVARVHVGQEIEALPLALPDRTLKGTIKRVSPNIDTGTHTLQIRSQVGNPDGALKPQMLVRVRIVTTPGTALVVPQRALVFETDGFYAFVQSGADAVARRRVAVASWNEAGYARVVAGLSAGERVVEQEALQVDGLWHRAHGESS